MYGKVQFHDRVFSMMWHAATAVLMTAILPACGLGAEPGSTYGAPSGAVAGVRPTTGSLRQVRSRR